MQQYEITMTGLTPLLMHQDNLSFGEKIQAWRKDPANKELCVSGDDRSPAWTWLGYLYHDGKTVGIPADNLMTLLREGGAKVKTGKMQETYKKHTQSGIMIDQQQFPITVGGNTISVIGLSKLIGDTEFLHHIEAVEAEGFELLVKRAKVGMAKHIRVRPLFRQWTAQGKITVLDPDLSGLTKPILESILKQAGTLVGVGDWRPSSPKSSGTFGTFSVLVRKV